MDNTLVVNEEMEEIDEQLAEEETSTETLHKCPSSSSLSCESLTSNDEYNQHLQARIVGLRDTINTLKAQLQDERETWMRELEERRENDYITRTAELGYHPYYGAAPANISTDPASSMTLSLSSIGDTDAIGKYSADNLLQNHYEHRQNLQKQIALANYKRRLLEVENMCNLELLRVKQNVQILQPLQMMCSEWKFPGECSGDGSNSTASKPADVVITDEEKLLRKPAEVVMPLEMLVQQEANDVVVACERAKSQPNLGAQI